VFLAKIKNLIAPVNDRIKLVFQNLLKYRKLSGFQRCRICQFASGFDVCSTAKSAQKTSLYRRTAIAHRIFGQTGWRRICFAPEFLQHHIQTLLKTNFLS